MIDDTDIRVLQDFVGSPPYEAFLKVHRQALIADIATLLGLPVNDLRILELHQRISLRLQLLVESRLDTIDLQSLASEAESQFETGLPTRISYQERLRDASSQ